MRTTICLVMLLAVSGLAAAGDTFRFDRGVVGTGDTVAELVQKAGKPDRRVQLENRYGGGTGERWEYYLANGRMVSFIIHDGRVLLIDEA